MLKSARDSHSSGQSDGARILGGILVQIYPLQLLHDTTWVQCLRYFGESDVTDIVAAQIEARETSEGVRAALCQASRSRVPCKFVRVQAWLMVG